MNSHTAPLEVGARSETGYVRDENQDRMSGTRVPLGHLYIVADGMGGHKGGAVAAELTVQELQRSIGEAPVDAAVEQVILTAFNKTNETVYQKAHAGDPETEGMGSTAVLVLISGRAVRVAHVGDSRAYLYRKGRLKQLTTDHTVVQKMVQAGMLKPEEASNHPNASVLDRAIGSSPSITVDISDPWRLKEGDAILLCSDGLSSYVTDTEISSVLRSQAPVQDIPERLINLALQKGGEDNVTVQFIQYGTRPVTRLSTPKLLPPLFQVVAAFVLGTALSAAGFYQYFGGEKSPFNTAQSAMKIELENTYAELESLQKQLNQEKVDRISTSEKLTGLSAQLEKISKSERSEIMDLEEELKKVMRERDDYKKQLEQKQRQAQNTENDFKKKLERSTRELTSTQQNLKAETAKLAAANKEISRLKSAGAPEPKTPSETQAMPKDDAPVREEPNAQ